MTDELMPTQALDVTAAPLELPRSRPRTRFLVAFLVGLLAAMAIGAGALYAFDRQYAGRILPGVRVGTVNLSGLTPAAASERLAEAFASFGQGRAILVAGDAEIPIDYDEVGRRPDVEAMVAEAMSIGRAGNPVEQVVADARTALRGVELQPRVTFDAERLARLVRIHAASLDVDPRDASINSTKDGFVVVDGVTGRQADHVAPTAALTTALARIDAPSVVTAEIPVVDVAPGISTLEADYARIAANRIARDVALVDDGESWTIPEATVRSWITFRAAGDGELQPVVDRAAIDAALVPIAKAINRKPVSASFTVSGSKITGVVPGKTGRALDATATAARISELLTARFAGGPNTPVAPALTVTAPALTTEEAKAAAPRMKRISTWTTYFPIGEKNGFGANIWIPALDIDGYVVGPGETFDFWKAVGPVTRARGYRDGGAIINGKTEPQGALAGGICSCSTTLFNTALRAGYEMGARRNHYYYIDRYPLGLDATVFISASGSKQTMSFTNDTEYPLLIRGYKIKKGGAGYVRFDIFSVPTGRTVSFSKPIVKNVRRASDTIQYTSSLPPGVRKRIEYPVDGKQVWVTRTVRDASGKIIHRETYYSNYARITGIVLVGK